MTIKKLGIWMDHSDAYLIDFNDESSEIKTISNPFNHEEKEEALSRSENLMHNKRQQYQAAFYKEIGNEISLYNEVVLFGPTSAKTELWNVLHFDNQFKNIRIDVVTTDKMSDNQKRDFVNVHFSKQICM